LIDVVERLRFAVGSDDVVVVFLEVREVNLATKAYEQNHKHKHRGDHSVSTSGPAADTKILPNNNLRVNWALDGKETFSDELLLLEELREAAAEGYTNSLAAVNVVSLDSSILTLHRSEHDVGIDDLTRGSLFVFIVRVIQLSDSCIMLPDLSLVGSGVVRIDEDLFLEVGNLLTGEPHLIDVLKSGLICEAILNIHDLILILLDLSHLWNALKLMTNNIL
jgi:hypothetical protein